MDGAISLNRENPCTPRLLDREMEMKIILIPIGILTGGVACLATTEITGRNSSGSETLVKGCHTLSR